MKRAAVPALAGLLVLSLVGLAWLARRDQVREAAWQAREAEWRREREDLERKTRLPRVIPEEWAEAGAPEIPLPEAGGDPLEAARAQIGKLEGELEEARRRLSRFDGMEPSMALVYSKRPLRDKLVEMMGLSDQERWQVAWLLGSSLGESPAGALEAMRLLVEETDAGLLPVIGEIVRAGALRSLPPEEGHRVMAVLREGSPAARRQAAAWAIRIDTQSGEPNSWAGSLAEAVRAESEPAVIGTLARSLAADAMTCPTELVEAFRSAVDRLPPGEGRREALSLLGMTAFLSGDEEEMFGRWEAAGDAALRDDIAHAIASVASRTGSAGPGGNSVEERDRALARARARFLAVYGETGDAQVRRELLRAAPYGLGLMGRSPESDAAFLAEMAAREPDREHRERLFRLSDAARGGATHGTSQWDAILDGRAR